MGENKRKIAALFKRYKTSVMVFGAAFILGLLAHILFLSEQKVQTLERGDYGQEEQEYTLLVDGLTEKEIAVEFPVSAKERSQEEAHRLYEKVLEELPGIISEDNVSLNQVRSNLKLVSSVDDSGVQLFWQSGDSEVINSYGEVFNEELGPEGQNVLLSVRMTDGSWPEEFTLNVKVFPPLLTGEEMVKTRFLQFLEKEDERQKTEEWLTLPTEFDGRQLYYRSTDRSPFGKLMFLGVLAAVLIVQKEADGGKKKEEQRKQQLMIDYPEVLSRLIIFLGAGMSIRTAWDRISGDYRKGRENGRSRERCVYEEMYRASCQMKSGVSEQKAFQEFGRRCGSVQYMKFASLLEQSKKNGSGNLRESLKLEMAEAFEQRKHAARRLGEEAGTKLLVPLFLLLAVVMIVIAVPALIEFG